LVLLYHPCSAKEAVNVQLAEAVAVLRVAAVLVEVAE